MSSRILNSYDFSPSGFEFGESSKAKGYKTTFASWGEKGTAIKLGVVLYT